MQTQFVILAGETYYAEFFPKGVTEVRLIVDIRKSVAKPTVYLPKTVETLYCTDYDVCVKGGSVKKASVLASMIPHAFNKWEEVSELEIYNPTKRNVSAYYNGRRKIATFKFNSAPNLIGEWFIVDLKAGDSTKVTCGSKEWILEDDSGEDFCYKFTYLEDSVEITKL